MKYLRGTNAEVVEYTAAEGTPITRKILRDISFPTGAIAGGVIRGEEAFVAVGSTQILPGDKVAIFAVPESLKAVDKLFR